MGRGTVPRLSWELERASPVRADGPVAVLPITGDPGKWRTAGRQSEGVVVVRGRESRSHGEGPLLHRCTRQQGRVVVSAQSARSVAQVDDLDKTRALQRVLYRSAKQDPARRFHACMATSPAAMFCGGHGSMWLLTVGRPVLLVSPSRASRRRGLVCSWRVSAWR